MAVERKQWLVPVLAVAWIFLCFQWAIMEFYLPGKSEPFGLNKRARRLAKGIPCTKPDGTFDKEVSKNFVW